jgi:Ca2+-binding RTX toxin-like protein
MDGGEGDDFLSGGEGEDQLDGGTGGDKMRGEAADDDYVVDNSGDHVIEVANEGYDEVFSLISFTLPADPHWDGGHQRRRQRVRK